MSSDYIIKILTLGDTEVGKTSIILRYTKATFPKKAISTIGVDFRSKIVELQDGKKAKILLWDTAGQERFRTVANNYYNGSDCVLFVFDVTKQATFKVLNYWIEKLQQKKKLDDVCMVLVGNKSDLENKKDLKDEDIKMFDEQYNMKYFEVSALKNEGIEEMFQYCIMKTLEIQKRKAEEEKDIRGDVLLDRNKRKGGCSC